MHKEMGGVRGGHLGVVGAHGGCMMGAACE